MQIISFGWTSAALIAGAKTVTRRDWDSEYAHRFHKGQPVQAYDKNPQCYGKQIGVIKLTQNPLLQPMTLMPDSDYRAEGLEWLFRHPQVVPAKARKLQWGACTRESFEDWRRSAMSLYVVRFEVVEIFKDAKERLEKLLHPKDEQLFGGFEIEKEQEIEVEIEL